MHDAIPSRILNGWLRLEEDLFHLQVLSYLPPQIPILYNSSLTHVDKKHYSQTNVCDLLSIKCSSYYKVVVFIDPLQGLYAILLEILWIVFLLLPLDGF